MIAKTLRVLNRWPWGLALNRRLYRLAVRLAVLVLSQEGTMAFYVRGSMGRGNFIPTISDIDLNVVIEKMTGERELHFFKTHCARRRFLTKLMPSLHICVYTTDDLTVAGNVGWINFLTPKEDWVFISGRNVLPIVDQPPARLMLGWTKLVFRRHQGLQMKVFNRDPRFNRKSVFKINENLLLATKRLLAQLGETQNSHVLRLTQLSDDVKKNNFCVADPAALRNEMLLESYGVVNNIAHKISPPQMTERKWGDYRPTDFSVAPETKTIVRARLEPFFEKLRGSANARPVAAVLSSVPNRNYGYKIYVVAKDDLSTEVSAELITWVRSVFWDSKSTWPKEYFGSFPAPVVVSESLFKQMGVSEKTPLEPYFLAKHGEIIFNHLGGPVPEMDKSLSVPSFLSECMHSLRYVRARRDLFPYGPVKFKTTFIDYITGTLPATRLLLEKKVIVTAPGEALAEYKDRIDSDYGRFLEKFYERYAGLPPERVDHQELMLSYTDHFGLIKNEADTITELYLKCV